MSSEPQGMTNLDDLLGNTQISSEKKTSSWADAPVEAPVEEKPVVKKAAWGSVQAPPVVSIKDQELEAKNAKPATKAPQRVNTQEPRSPPLPRSDRPSYNEDRPYPSDYRTYGAGARRGGAPGGYEQRDSRWGSSSGSSGGVRGGDRYGSDRGDRYGDRGDRYGDRGDRYGGRDSYQDEERRSDRFGDRPRYNPDMPSHGGAPSRREPRPEVPFPSQPPYICYMAGLSEGTEADVREQLPEFWGPELAPRVKSVRVPTKDGYLKHAFIEFEDADALREALTCSGREFLGRPVTCLVAEPPANRNNDRFGSGRRDDRGERSFGSGFRSQEPPGEYKRLQLAPRTLPVSSDASSGSTSTSSSKKNDPFGGATASARDIYATKAAEPTPATTAPAARKPEARSPTNAKTQEESRADVSDWKSKKDSKPASGFRPANTANGSKSGRTERTQQGGRGSAARGNDGDWRSAGKARKPSSPSTNTGSSASTTTSNPSGSNSGSGGNIFDNLDNE